jgi:hypothetical protein
LKACWPRSEELIPFAISLEFHFEIQPKGCADPKNRPAPSDQPPGPRHQRLDDFGVLFQGRDRRTHRRQIDEQRDARKVLQDAMRATTNGISSAAGAFAFQAARVPRPCRRLFPRRNAQHGFEEQSGC